MFPSQNHVLVNKEIFLWRHLVFPSQNYDLGNKEIFLWRTPMFSSQNHVLGNKKPTLEDLFFRDVMFFKPKV